MKPITHPIALQALAAARPDPVPEVYDSRTADKFVFRTTKALAAELKRLGQLSQRSMNAEVVLAVTEYLRWRERNEVMHKALSAYLGPVHARAVIASVQPFKHTAPRKGTARQIVVRFPPGVRGEVFSAKDEDQDSMNNVMLQAILWWVNIQRQTHALLAACAATELEAKHASRVAMLQETAT